MLYLNLLLKNLYNKRNLIKIILLLFKILSKFWGDSLGQVVAVNVGDVTKWIQNLI